MKKCFLSLVILLSTNNVKASLLMPNSNDLICGSEEMATSSDMVTDCDKAMSMEASDRSESMGSCSQMSECSMSSEMTIPSDMGSPVVANCQMLMMESDNYPMQMCLMKAVMGNDFESVRSMVESGVDVNSRDKNGKTALMCAADTGHFEIYDYLVKNGADVFMRDNMGNSVLFYACSKNRSYNYEIDQEKIYKHQDIILSLLESGVDF